MSLIRRGVTFGFAAASAAVLLASCGGDDDEAVVTDEATADVVEFDGVSAVSRPAYVATGLDGHGEPVDGWVLDTTFGRERGALELHWIDGARPDTDYEVGALIYFATECAPDDEPFVFPEGVLRTDGAGRGHFTIAFDGQAFVESPSEFNVRWQLSVDGEAAYETSCVRVSLDQASST